MMLVENGAPVFALGLCLLLGLGCGDEQVRTSSEAAETTAASDTSRVDTTSSDTVASVSSPRPDTATAAPMDTASAPAESSAQPGALTAAQKDRLGPTLRRLLRGDSLALDRMEPVGRRDGAPVYSVTIESSDPSALRAAGVPLTSVQGAIVTARLTPDQIRTAAAVEGVQMIRADAPVRPHASPESPSPDMSPGASPSAGGSP